MNSLPLSIEGHLKEIGFSVTEILILRQMISGCAYTLRQIASKTGKSTGALDQGMKKLIQKQIIERTMINNSPKYVLENINAITRFLNKSTKHNMQQLQRRQQDLLSFLSAVELEQSKPSIFYFEDQQGIEKAYAHISEHLSGPMYAYMPIRHKEEENPFSSVLQKFTQKRIQLKQHLKVLTYDSLLARRYQEKDLFYNRSTQFIDKNYFHESVDRILTSDMLCCINHEAQQASILHYPELAKAEIASFSAMWNETEKILHQQSVHSC